MLNDKWEIMAFRKRSYYAAYGQIYSWLTAHRLDCLKARKTR